MLSCDAIGVAACFVRYTNVIDRLRFDAGCTVVKRFKTGTRAKGQASVFHHRASPSPIQLAFTGREAACQRCSCEIKAAVADDFDAVGRGNRANRSTPDDACILAIVLVGCGNRLPWTLVCPDGPGVIATNRRRKRCNGWLDHAIECAKTVGADCTYMSAHYGVVAGETFGKAPQNVRDHWVRQKCDAAACKGVGQLQSGDEIWKRASNLWKTKDGSKTFCSVKCAANTTLTKKSGDTYYCKPNPVQCKGEFKSVPNGLEKIATQGQTVTLKEAAWIFYGGNNCYNKGDFSKGKNLKCDNNVFGDPKSGVKNTCHAMFKVEAAPCKGEGSLKANATIIRKASNMWKTADGKNTYCSVECASNTTLTKKSGDTYYCKPNAATCKGEFTSIPGGLKLIAREGQTVTLDKAAWVFYGANSCFNKGDFSKNKKWKCANSEFGDPLSGVGKRCYAMFK